MLYDPAKHQKDKDFFKLYIMVIQIDDKEGAIGIRVRDFEDKKGDYQKGYKQYHYCSKGKQKKK